MSTGDHEQDGFDRDDDLRALLRSGDPAGSLPPADPAALASLLEDIMSADLELRTDPADHDGHDGHGDRTTGTHGRNRLTWLVAAAAAAVIFAAGGYAVSGLGDQSSGPQAGETGSTTGDQATIEAGAPLAGQTTALTATVPQGRCAVPDASFISGSEQAFEGTVTAIDGEVVTLQATDVFTGEVGETIQVTAMQSDFRSMIQAVRFEVGGTYLVSATDGMVSLCGLSGQATGELRSLYDKAFVR